ncbi:MAG: hypothetical protein K1W13_02575 [Lachnospiraceae bacterium]
MANGKIKINELPETTLAKDNDIFIIENDNTTQKISLGSLINYIKEHEEIAAHFVKQASIDSPNGIAPLDNNRKIPHANLPFGSVENTVYDGALGQSLSDSLSAHLADTDNPHTITKSQIGLSDVDNTADAAKPVSALQQKAIDIAYASSNAYTDVKIADLIDGAPSTLDTLGEIAKALQEGSGISDALDAAIGTKANQAELDSHTGNDTIHITASERTKWNNKIGNTGDTSNTTVKFSEASDLSNIQTGEKTGSIMGKISKAISAFIRHITAKAAAGTLGHVTLSDTYRSAIAEGTAADGMGASQKAVADAYSALNNRLSGLTFEQDAEGNWGYKPAGADTVTPFKSGSYSLVGRANQNNSWTINSRKHSNTLVLTGLAGSTGSGSFAVYGTTADNVIPYHVNAANTLIENVTIAAGTTREIDISGYDRFIVYCVYTTQATFNINIQVDN